jgi:hypothetical protein
LISACSGGGGAGGSTATTSVDIFDGAALFCTVTSGGTTATESGGGKYTFASALGAGAIVTATGCTDSDTHSLLPKLSGVAQSGAVAISPITTLIVEAAIAGDLTATSISETALDAAIAAIVTKLGLGTYEPTNFNTANYVTAAKADTNGTGTAAVAMRVSLAISTLLKSIEVAAGSANASAAVSAVSQAIAESVPVIDLTQSTGVEAVMTAAQTIAPTVATAIQTASDAIVPIVVLISSATGDITIAIAATTVVSEFLNTADETTIADTAVIAALTTDVETAKTPAPTIASFNAASSTITAGTSVDLTAGFNDGTGSINNGIGAVSTGVAKNVTPSVTTTYTLTVTNSVGTQVTSTVTVTVVAQLAVNGDFEAGDLSSWTEIPNGGTINAVNDTASDSTWFVNLVAGPNDAPAISLAGLGVGAVMPGDTIDVSFDMCGTAAAGGVIFPALLSEFGGGADRVNLATIASPPSVWTRYNYSTTAGSNVTGGVSLLLDVVCGADASCTADVYFDNVSITLGGGPVAGSASGNNCISSVGPNLVVNGDMETGNLIGNPADGWVDSNDGGGILTADNSFNNGGSYSAKAIASVSQEVLLKQTEIGKGIIVAGDSIEVSYDLLVAFMPPGGVVNGQVLVKQDGGGVTQTEEMTTITANQGWRTETISFTVGSVDVTGGITLQFNVICGDDAGCEADANIDNVSVTVIGT